MRGGWKTPCAGTPGTGRKWFGTIGHRDLECLEVDLNSLEADLNSELDDSAGQDA